MASLEEMFKMASEDCRLLVEDMHAIIVSRQNDEKASKKSLEPVTRLRKDSEEMAESLNTDPDDQFIKDKLSDIFGE